MAAHSAAKAIDTQGITDKARRDLLQLLETVRTRRTWHVKDIRLMLGRFEARRI